MKNRLQALSLLDRAMATMTDAEITAAVEERLAGERGLRRKALLAARVALVKLALECLPPRQDPDALIVPDHL